MIKSSRIATKWSFKVNKVEICSCMNTGFVVCSRWYWQKQKLQPYVDFMQKNYAPDFKYQDFASQFTAEFFDAKEWTDIFASSGAKYIVLTTKHHEGRGQEKYFFLV